MEPFQLSCVRKSVSQQSAEQDRVNVTTDYINFCLNITEKYPNSQTLNHSSNKTHPEREHEAFWQDGNPNTVNWLNFWGFSSLYCIPHVFPVNTMLPSALSFLHTIPSSLIILQVPGDKKKKKRKMYKLCSDLKFHSTYNFRGFQAVLWKSVNKVKVVCCLTKMQFPYSNISGSTNKKPPITSLIISSQTFHL